MSDTVEADLSVELNVSCPKCDNYFDLMEHDDDVLGRMNEDGGVIMECCPSEGHWLDSHGKYSEDVTCPQCSEVIKVRGIAW